MNKLGTTMTEMLIGALDDAGDPGEVGELFVAAGGNPADLVVLSGPEGLDEVLAHGSGRGLVGRIQHLARHIDRLDSSGTGHVLAATESALASGRTVIAVRHVHRAEAASFSDLLRSAGVSHVHYVGRWTLSEFGEAPGQAEIHALAA
jgi:hypothetical protein